MGLTTETKDEIRAMLTAYVEQSGGVEKASARLKSVSGTTIYSIRKGRYTNISDDLWRSIRAQIDGHGFGDWVVVETTATKDISFAMNDTKENVGVTWIIAKAGGSKTVSAARFLEENKNTFYLLCDEDMRKRDFGIELCRAIGFRPNTQKKARSLIMEVIDEVNEMENPTIIFDEADKLSDAILHYFITIINHLVGKATIIFLSTSYIQYRMERGLRLNKPGYQELFSRIGRKFYTSYENNANDVYAICRANGLNDENAIGEVIKDAEPCEFDLRRVKRKIIALRKKLLTMGKTV